MFKKILLAFDGSDGSNLALEKTAELAKLAEAEVHILAVGRIPEYAETMSEVEGAKEQAQSFYAKNTEAALDHLKERGLSAKVHIDFGKPGDVILRLAEEWAADLIVLGTKPHSVLRRRFLGATVDKVVDYAHCSVLVVRS